MPAGCSLVHSICNFLHGNTKVQVKSASTPSKSVLKLPVNRSPAIAASDLLPDFRTRHFLERLPLGRIEGTMKKSRFSEEEMVAIVREADRDPVAEVAKRHKISQQTIYLMIPE